MSYKGSENNSDNEDRLEKPLVPQPYNSNF